MRLRVYSSKPRGDEPNLVAVQDVRLTHLPTLLVCPIQRSLLPAPFRAGVSWREARYVVACDLVRPINRRVLRLLGELGDEDSHLVIEALLRLIADVR